MENDNGREIKRGDVYWALFGGELGSSLTQAHRPVLVVSSDKGNETSPWVMMVPLTTKMRWGVISPVINSVGQQSWAKCSQVMSIDKDRLGSYLGTVNESEMAAVDLALRVSLSLNQMQDKEDDGEKRALEEEIDSLKSQISALKNAKKDEVVERDMYRGLYEKALDRVVWLKFGKDIESRLSVEPEVEPKVESEVEPKVEEKPKVEQKIEPKVEPEVEPEVEPVMEPEVEQRVEINTCTPEELRNCGCSPTVIKYIVSNRPYKSVEELKAIPQMTRFAYQILKSKICCVPPRKANETVVPRESKKVNVNTATDAEMMAIGMPKQLARAIRAYRDANGKYQTLEDLYKTRRFGTGCMDKYGLKLEV